MLIVQYSGVNWKYTTILTSASFRFQEPLSKLYHLLILISNFNDFLLKINLIGFKILYLSFSYKIPTGVWESFYGHLQAPVLFSDNI